MSMKQPRSAARYDHSLSCCASTQRSQTRHTCSCTRVLFLCIESASFEPGVSVYDVLLIVGMTFDFSNFLTKGYFRLLEIDEPRLIAHVMKFTQQHALQIVEVFMYHFHGYTEKSAI